MERFGKDGRLIMPLEQRGRKRKGVDERNVRWFVTEAYCPKGCSIVDKDHKINGVPGLRLKFKRLDMQGEVVLSAIQNFHYNRSRLR